jgi:basic membrane protein A and related proteins
MRFIRPKMLVATSVFALVAAACGGATPEGEGGGGGDGGEAEGPRIGVALDIGGLGDKSFNDAADRGLQQAI